MHSLQETVLPQPMLPVESRDSEGVPFASLESLSLWPGIVPKSGHVIITKIENLHIPHVEKFTDSKMLFLSIYDEK